MWAECYKSDRQTVNTLSEVASEVTHHSVHQARRSLRGFLAPGSDKHLQIYKQQHVILAAKQDDSAQVIRDRKGPLCHI